MAVGGIEGWNNDYCLNPIPDGYEISFHDAEETFREIYYSKDTAVIGIFQYDASTATKVDKETTVCEKVMVRNKHAYYFEDKVSMST